MDKKLNPETQDKQVAPEVKDEALDQVHGGKAQLSGMKTGISNAITPAPELPALTCEIDHFHR